MIRYYVIATLVLFALSAGGKLLWLGRGAREWNPSHEAWDVALHIALIAFGFAALVAEKTA